MSRELQRRSIAASPFFWIGIVECAADLRDALDGHFFEPRPGRFASRDAAARQKMWIKVTDKNQSWHKWARKLHRSSADFWHLFAELQLRDPLRLPKWAKELRTLLLAIRQGSTRRDKPDWIVRQSTDPLFALPLCMPCARYAIARFETHCATELLRQLSKRARRRLDALLVTRLLSALTPAASAYFEKFKLQNDASSQWPNSSASSEHALATQFFLPSPDIRLVGLLNEFPVLGRLIVDLMMNWQSATKEFLKRLQSDWVFLRRSFNLSYSSTASRQLKVLDLRLGLSDPHSRGRTVMGLRLRGSSWVVYKPRNCQGELEWARLVQCLRERQLRPYVPKVIARARYGWMEFVHWRPCRSGSAVRKFYRRAGALLCVAQVAQVIDLHRDNLIAAGAHPVVIDVESLWHKSRASLAFKLPPLYRTGFLPLPAGMRYHVEFSHTLDSNDLELQQTHRPQLNGLLCRACDFIDDIEEGFRRAAIDLCGDARQRARCYRLLSRIAAQPWRQILKPTAWYARTRELARDPVLLRDGSKRYLTILRECAGGDFPAAIAAAEVQSLAQFDIPRFARPVRKAQIREVPSKHQLLKMLPQIRETLLAPLLS
jgi:hypothetical protein